MRGLLLRTAFVATVILIGSVPRSASAQASAAETGETQEVVPPRLLEDPGVSYPRRALDERFYERVEVVLILDLDDAGRVLDARVEQETGHGFDEEALQAARRLRFEPALRGGEPAPARIRFRYVFDPPPPTLVGRVLDAQTGRPLSGVRIVVRMLDLEHSVLTDPDGSWSAPTVSPGSARVAVESSTHRAERTELALRPGAETNVVFRLEPEPVESAPNEEPEIEVTVRGEPLPPAVSSYTREEVRKIPGAFGDPFRAVETLPGVTPVFSGLPYFYVRGAPPGNVGYFLDGVRVPYLYHIGLGPSVVHPAIVERVDLHPGGYPARIGRFAGGVVSATMTEPRPELHGEGNVRLFDLGGVVESGFAEGRGTVLVGGRYSYTAALVSLIVPALTLDYRDYQARISYDLTPNDRVSIFSFGSYDLLGQTKSDILEVLFGTEFYRVDLRYDHSFSTGRLRTAVTLGYDRTNAGFIAGEQRNVVDRSIAARTELVKQLGKQALLRGGTDITADNYRIRAPRYPSDPENPETQGFQELFPARTDLAAGAWIDLTFDVVEDFQVTPGVRADLYRSAGMSAFGFEPRFAGRWALHPTMRLIPAFGLAHQPPSFILPIPGLVPTLEGGLQRSLQNSVGVELDLGDVATAGSTLFYNVLSNTTDSISSAVSEGGAPDFRHRSRGRSFGTELFLRRRLTRRLGGFVSYTLSRSEHTGAAGTRPSAADRTHVLNAAASYGLGRGWSAGSRFVFFSGAPVQESGTGGDGGARPPRAPAVDRESPFFRLDLRLEKRWMLADRAWISFIAEVMNATLSQNSLGGEDVGPFILPSLGAEAGF